MEKHTIPAWVLVIVIPIMLVFGSMLGVMVSDQCIRGSIDADLFGKPQPFSCTVADLLAP